MKKLFLFVATTALTLSLNSCSKDDNNGGSSSSAKNTITCKVDGTKKTYKLYGTPTVSGGTISVDAYIGSQTSPSEMVNITVPTGTTGADKVDMMFVNVSTQDMYMNGESFHSNVTANDATAKTLKGTFEGTTVNMMDSSTKTVTEGSFDIKY